MTIKLYTNNSRDNQRIKNLTQLESFEGTLRSASSIIDPNIVFEGALNPNANYMYIEEFQRYYFIKNIISVRDNLYEIQGHCDVLSSAGSGLDNCKGIVRRQENRWNLYLDDGVFKAYSNPNIVQKEFPSGFSLNDMSYILAVAGS